MAPPLRRLLTPAALVLLAGCGEAPALEVGEVAFGSSELAGLSEGQIRELVRITAVGLAHLREEPQVPGAPVLDRRRAEARIALLRQEVVLEAAGAGDDVLRARYRTNPYPELVVRHLLIRAERGEALATREAARRRAEAALARARAGEPFPELAAELSEEPGANSRGGLLAPGREGAWVREFWEAAVDLEEGEVSGVVETVYGYHVLKLEERRAIPFEEARPRVAEEVARMVDDGEAWSARVEEWTEGLEVGSEEAGRAARDRILLREADARGLSLPDDVATRIEAGWARTVARWAGALGLAAVTTAGDLPEAAVRALGATGQEARIARREMEEFAPALEAAYPVVRP